MARLQRQLMMRWDANLLASSAGHTVVIGGTPNVGCPNVVTAAASEPD